MKYASLSEHSFVLRLDPADDVHETIQNLCSQESITNASVQGIGSLESPTLAHYSIKTKHFTDKHLEGIYEVTSLLGNVSLVDGQPFAHVHVTISDDQMQTFGGHLVKGDCSATLELIIRSYPSSYSKLHSEAIGLKVWDF